MTEETPLPDDRHLLNPVDPEADDENDILNETNAQEDTAETVKVSSLDDELDIDDTSEPVVDTSAIEESEEAIGDDDTDIIGTLGDITADTGDEDDTVRYPGDVIDARGEKEEELFVLFESLLNQYGPVEFATRIRDKGTFANLLYRAMQEQSEEEQRQRQALGDLSAEDRKSVNLSSVLRNEEGKPILRTSHMSSRKLAKGEVKRVSGEEALLAFASAMSNSDNSEGRGGAARIPLFNTGITLDVLVPTGIDYETLLQNCIAVDREMGARLGGHYFFYADSMIKTQVLKFLFPLIVDSSYADWKKRGKLWSVIKLPDLNHLILAVAAICYRKGFEGFTTKCTRPVSDTHPAGCGHTEKLTVDLLKMLITRWSAMSQESIAFMVNARLSDRTGKNTLQEISAYQKGLGLEGEKITYNNITFTMRIPTITEHMDAAIQFLTDIENEVEGDNTQGKYAMAGLRYLRAFVPWVASISTANTETGNSTTDDPMVIQHVLDQCHDLDIDQSFRKRLLGYINKVQLTYVGFPAMECPVCKYTADTPSGLLTVDPFSAFFTVASKYTNQAV